MIQEGAHRIGMSAWNQNYRSRCTCATGQRAAQVRNATGTHSQTILESLAVLWSVTTHIVPTHGQAGRHEGLVEEGTVCS